MPSRFSDQLNDLRSLTLEIRQQQELAEARVATANQLLSQLAATELTNDQIFVGDVVLQRPYGVHADTSSGQIIQAALSVSGGFGAILWDSEEFAALKDSPQFEAEAALMLLPFGQCGAATKALLLPQLELLLGRLLRSLNPA